MTELVGPTATLHESWLRARDEWPEGHQDGSGLRPDDEVETNVGFAAWVDRLTRQADRSTPVEPGQVHSNRWWMVGEADYLGVVELRHELTPLMLEAVGHIGNSVRPTARGRGLATWALGAVLPRARRLGLGRVLLTCDEHNVASSRTIENNGGVLEDVRDTALGRKRRYWIELPA
jgi:predicted acetyltransferase